MCLIFWLVIFEAWTLYKLGYERYYLDKSDDPWFFVKILHELLYTEPVLSMESGRVVHVLWGTICWPLDVSC